MAEGFIKNEDLLKEDYRVADLLDFSIIAASFKKKITSINKPAIIALVGPFGAGKSTMLFQLEKDTEIDGKWINFDAWKYPDRQNLWEGFVLDFSRLISPEAFLSTDKKIRGKQNDDKKTLVSTLSRIPGFAALEGLNHFLETSPAQRVDEIQQILKEQILKAKTNLFIILEDIDRSGDSGIFFLETLKQFVSSLDSEYKFIVIVPMSDFSYHQNLDSYLKSIDYFEFFRPNSLNLEQFVNTTFDSKLFEGSSNREGDNKLEWTGEARRGQTISFLEGLFIQYPAMSMRLLKLILRKANLVYKNQAADGHHPDFRVTICLEAGKYFDIDKSGRKYFNEFKESGSIAPGTIFSSFLFAMLMDYNFVYEVRHDSSGKEAKNLYSSPRNFKFIDRVNGSNIDYPSVPWAYGSFPDDKGFGIAGFYKDY